MSPINSLATFADVPEGFLKNAVLTVIAVMSAIALALAIYNGARTALGKTKNATPQPLIVAMQEEFATKNDHRELKGEVASLASEIRTVDKDRRESVNRAYRHFEAAIKEMRIEGKEENRGIHNRLDGLAETLATLVGEVKHLTK